MLRVIVAEVLDERRYLAVELDVETLDDIEPTVAWLPCYNPVFIRYNILSI